MDFFLDNSKLQRILKEVESPSWQYIAAAVITLAVLVAAIILFFRLKAWLNEDNDPASIDHQMLSEISELQRRGELTSEEFRSIKGQLVSRLSSTAKPSGDNSADRKKSSKESEDLPSGNGQS